MNVVLWILQALLAAMFLMAGLPKLLGKTRDGQPYSAATGRFIGLAEVVGAIGLILPGALDIAPDLTGYAAIGIAVIMLLAAIVHGRRKETQGVVMTIVLLLVALFVVFGRLGFEPY